MNRRDFLRAASLTALAAGYSLDPAEAAAALIDDPPAPTPAPAAPYPPPFDSHPVLQSPAPDGMTVFICVNTISTAWVEFGETPSLGQVTHSALHGLRSLSGRVHRIRLTNLKPGTRYHYRVVICPISFRSAYRIRRGEPVASSTFSFTTLDAGRGPKATFSVINDTHENPETLAAATSFLNAAPADLTFWNGDIFNDVRSDPQIVEQIMRPPPNLPYAATSPLCFVSGNHDVRGIHARSLDAFIDVPGGKRHYLLRQGPVAFIVLDTGEDKDDNHPGYAGLGEFSAYRESQRLWLDGTLKDPLFRSAPFKVAILHIPLHGKASNADCRNKWHAPLAAAGIDLAINGHVHEFAYHPPDRDRPYAQLVGGGPAPPTATVIRAAADRRQLLVTVLDLSGKEIGSFPFRRT
ncbi:MAG: metallophosphoesterase [Phycisphaeraceae bacterium]|nr:metallophosphoesterase [Phycisphaeraceae bacterium]